MAAADSAADSAAASAAAASAAAACAAPLPGYARAVVIGGGPAGLSALRELLAAGVCDALLVEEAGDIGGVYPRAYAGARLTTSTNLTAFGAYPAAAPGRPRHWAAGEYAAYLRAFAAASGLWPRTRLRARVAALQLLAGGGAAAGGALLTVERLAGDGSGAVAGTHALRCAHVVVCVGLAGRPCAPASALPGAAAFQAGGGGGGALLHSSELRCEAQLAGRRVLVVGGGESGADICLMAARAGVAAAVSLRAGPGYTIPRSSGGLPSDVDTCRAYHALPRWLLAGGGWWHRAKLWLEAASVRRAAGDADAAVAREAAAMNARTAGGAGPFARFGCKNESLAEAVVHHGLSVRPALASLHAGGATFVDGSTFACDVVVACTGFAPRFTFLEAAHPRLAASLRDIRRALWMRMLHPALGTRLIFCGLARPGLGAIPPLAEMHARLAAAYITGALAPPPPAAMRAAIDAAAAVDVATYPTDAGRITALCDYAPTMDALAGLLGVRPSLRELLLAGHLRVAWAVLFSSLSGAQFRLRGPGACFNVAAPALAAYPTLPLPVVFFELASLLACYALAGLGFRAYTPLMRTFSA